MTPAEARPTRRPRAPASKVARQAHLLHVTVLLVTYPPHAKAIHIVTRCSIGRYPTAPRAPPARCRSPSPRRWRHRRPAGGAGGARSQKVVVQRQGGNLLSAEAPAIKDQERRLCL